MTSLGVKVSLDCLSLWPSSDCHHQPITRRGREGEQETEGRGGACKEEGNHLFRYSKPSVNNYKMQVKKDIPSAFNTTDLFHGSCFLVVSLIALAVITFR